jgi:hypothetical protein
VSATTAASLMRWSSTLTITTWRSSQMQQQAHTLLQEASYSSSFAIPQQLCAQQDGPSEDAEPVCGTM